METNYAVINRLMSSPSPLELKAGFRQSSQGVSHCTQNSGIMSLSCIHYLSLSKRVILWTCHMTCLCAFQLLHYCAGAFKMTRALYPLSSIHWLTFIKCKCKCKKKYLLPPTRYLPLGHKQDRFSAPQAATSCSCRYLTFGQKNRLGNALRAMTQPDKTILPSSLPRPSLWLYHAICWTPMRAFNRQN